VQWTIEKNIGLTHKLKIVSVLVYSLPFAEIRLDMIIWQNNNMYLVLVLKILRDDKHFNSIYLL